MVRADMTHVHLGCGYSSAVWVFFSSRCYNHLRHMKAVLQSCPPYEQGAQLMVVSAPSLFAKAWVTPGSSQPTPERLQLLRHNDVALCMCRHNQRSISRASVHPPSPYGRCWRGGYADGEAIDLMR